MRKILFTLTTLAFLASWRADACTNVIVTKGASADGSTMVSYAADSHYLYGELYFNKASRFSKGAKLPITEWDTARPLGSIAQVERTYQTAGNMNQYQLIIAETTWGGREELADSTGVMDYGSLIYVTLQRARTAREAISTIVELANTYGYPSEGESFSIADPQEAWVMDLCGKGSSGNKGIVWVARRIPDGYICAHANQARITRFPLNDPENCLYAPDVISFAREQGYFSGADEEFSYRDAYCPLDFGGARACEARAWSAFNILGDGKFVYEENGVEVCRDAYDWVEYALGHELSGEMPLWIKPSRKISMKDVADVMRDHFEGTPMDMTTDIGAGGNALPYRWRPMGFSYGGKNYCNERAIATQQTGFWFVAQSRGWLPDEVGALIWFGTDDAATSYLTPIYVNTKKVPECFRVGNGDLLHYSATSSFWMNNRIANACYKMYDQMAPVVRKAADDYENTMMNETIPQMDEKLSSLVKKGRKGKARRLLTKFSVDNAQKQFAAWTKLEEILLLKFIDGNVKQQDENGEFKHSEYSKGIPARVSNPGYTAKWKEMVAKDNGEILEKR
ncbi:MAG: C69 family dipeptidase [Bacteroidales bacterium]|nr:C69 family dipeptidase [Candidatus Cryptobacteroides equifaecalis]